MVPQLGVAQAADFGMSRGQHAAMEGWQELWNEDGGTAADGTQAGTTAAESSWEGA